MRNALIPILLFFAACSTATGGDDGEAATCEPTSCARDCHEAGFRTSDCSGGLCRCADPHDAGTDVEPDAGDDGGADAPDAETEADAEIPEDAAEASVCDGFDLETVPGNYTGTFTGTIHALGEDNAMAGDVAFAVTEESAGHWTFAGTMNGTAMGGVYAWTSRVQGTIDCERVDGAFHDGTVTVEGIDYHFEGTLESSFVPYGCPDGTFTGRCTDCPVIVTGDGNWTVERD
jgi:hypothetical protein